MQADNLSYPTTLTARNEQRLRVNMVSRPSAMSGTSRYVATLSDALRALDPADLEIVTSTAQPPAALLRFAPLAARIGWDLPTFFNSYPTHIPAQMQAITHLTTQTLGIALLGRRRSAIVTVHDIIPYMLRHDRELCSYNHPAQRLCDYLAMRGLKRAAWLIADSQYTKQMVVEHLGYPARRISVVPLAVDHAVFRPLAVEDGFYSRYSLDPARRYLLYVGSFDRRKNFARLLRAFAEVAGSVADLDLVCVGEAHNHDLVVEMKQLGAELGVAERLHLVGAVSEADLVQFYNLASVAALPSLYEGFGLTALEAMACGAPLLAARSSSIVEIVGAAAFLADPMRVDELAEQLALMLGDAAEVARRRELGLHLAHQYTWQQVAWQTMDVYRSVAAGLSPAARLCRRVYVWFCW